jgi:hypothetical protein
MGGKCRARVARTANGGFIIWPPQLANRTPTIFPRRQITSQTRLFESPCESASSNLLGTSDGIAAITFAPLADTSKIWHSWSARPGRTIHADEWRARRTGLWTRVRCTGMGHHARVLVEKNLTMSDPKARYLTLELCCRTH